MAIKTGSRQPAFLVPLLAIMIGVLSMMLMVVVHRKANCQDPLVTNISDLRSLLITLQTWEAQNADHPAQAGLRRVTTELESLLVSKSTSPPPPVAVPAASSSAAVEKGSLRALAVGGTQCFVSQSSEFWGEPVVWGPEHHTPDAAECCAACHAHALAAARGGLDAGPNSTTCNTWVYCGDPDRCGQHYRECWLKHQKEIPPPEARAAASGANGNSMWTSGVVYGSDGDWLKQYDGRTTLTLHFELGDVVVKLLPELAPASVRELRRMAALLALEGTGCDGCKLYRSEVNFLVQGVIRHPGAYVATPRRPNPPQKKMMQRGLACWAGGMGGPDWFVNLIDQSGFGDDHLCWGKIDDMALLDAIVKLPTKPKAKPNEMTFLAKELRFNMTLS